MSLLPGRTIVLLPALLLVGCITTPAQKGRSPLKPARMSPDSVVLDIFFVRFPFDDPQVNGQLWQEIDEQHFPPELRRRLTANGFRVGLVGGQLPLDFLYRRAQVCRRSHGYLLRPVNAAPRTRYGIRDARCGMPRARVPGPSRISYPATAVKYNAHRRFWFRAKCPPAPFPGRRAT